MPLSSWRAALSRRRTPDVPPHRHPKVARRIARVERSSATLEQSLTELADRVTDLEQGLLEQRRLSLRVAELADLVTELVGAAARGDEEFRRTLDRLAPPPTGTDGAARHDG